MYEITIDEILERGIKLPEDRLSFPVEEFEYYKKELRTKGGIYCFTVNSNYLYVGISANLESRLRAHVNGTGRGNENLHSELSELSEVYLTIIYEPNVSLREFYENYLIIVYTPKHNKSKVSEIKDGYSVNPKATTKVQECVIEMYLGGATLTKIKNTTGVTPSSQYAILRSNGIPISRAKSKGEISKQRDEIEKYRIQGVSTIGISRIMNLTYANTWRIVKDLRNKDKEDE